MLKTCKNCGRMLDKDTVGYEEEGAMLYDVAPDENGEIKYEVLEFSAVEGRWFCFACGEDTGMGKKEAEAYLKELYKGGIK